MPRIYDTTIDTIVKTNIKHAGSEITTTAWSSSHEMFGVRGKLRVANVPPEMDKEEGVNNMGSTIEDEARIKCAAAFGAGSDFQGRIVNNRSHNHENPHAQP